MELIKEISEKNVITNSNAANGVKYFLRKAARAVLFKEDKIALLFVSKNNYHKLPGGGIEQGESIEEALSREILEETGCTCKIKENLGMTIEYRDTMEMLQISYVFSAEVFSKSKRLNFTEEEASQGFILEWHTLEEVKELFSQDTPNDYDGHFISVRDRAIIEYFQKLKNS
jgi:8-oxo-dGTP diphosphatase